MQSLIKLAAYKKDYGFLFSLPNKDRDEKQLNELIRGKPNILIKNWVP